MSEGFKDMLITPYTKVDPKPRKQKMFQIKQKGTS